MKYCWGAVGSRSNEGGGSALGFTTELVASADWGGVADA